MEKIWKWLTSDSGSENSLSYVIWFNKNFQPSDFDGIDRMFASFIQYCAKLSIVPTSRFLESYLKIDAKTDIKKYNIRVDTMQAFNYKESSQLEEAVEILKSIVTSTYEVYCTQDLTDRDFRVDMYEYISKRKGEAIQMAFMQYYPRLSDGSDVTEVSDELQHKLSTINKVFDTDRLKDIDFLSKREDTDSDEMEYICKTGLPCVDGDIGGIYSKLIYTINGQPASGKTRIAEVHGAYNVMTEAKKDVLFFETELSKGQVENILIAYHIVKKYGGKFKIPDSVLNRKKEMSVEQRQIYESAKIDLFESGNYGKFIFTNELIAEELEDTIINYIRLDSNIKLIVIDYAGLAKSKPKERYGRRLEQYEIITMVYEAVRSALLRGDFAAWILNQYNDKGIDAAYSGKEIRPGHVQGGMIVQRHTDYDISVTFTHEQELAKVRMMSTSKTRGTAGFRNVMFKTDLSVSIFNQMIADTGGK